MTTIRHLIATLHRHTAPPASRPFPVDLGLAAGFFCAWLALCGYEPLVAAATDELRLAVSTGPYHLRWPAFGPTAIGFAGLVLAWIRHRTPSVLPQLQERLQRATLLAASLLALRLLASGSLTTIKASRVLAFPSTGIGYSIKRRSGR